MGFFDDFADNYLGWDPAPQAPQLTPAQKMYLYQLQQQQAADAAAAEQKAAADGAAAEQQAAAAQQAAAQQQPVAQQPAAQFDPTPFRSQVDSSFSMFTPDFYAKKYADVYEPYKTSVENQYKLAKDSLTAGVAKRGLIGSQQGRGLFQQLDQLRDQSLNQGQQAAQSFQSSLSNAAQGAKDTLYGSIGAGADNASIGTRAATEASKVAGTATPQSSLGDIFGNLIQPYVNTSSPSGPGLGFSAATGNSNLNLANVGGGPAASTKVVGKKKF